YTLSLHDALPIYSSSFVRSRSSAPSRSELSRPTELLDNGGYVLGPEVLPVAVVHGDDGRVAAAAEALDRAERDPAVVGRLAGPHPELLLERLDHPLRADERARQVGADLYHVPADGLEVE